MDVSAYKDAATRAAQEAGAIIKAAWNTPRNVMYKGDVDLVTDVDQRCESVIVDRLRGQFPEHKFIGEEDSAAQGATAALTDDPTWMIDPVDGTTNFVHKLPFVCVCIGLAVKREVVVGVVFNPILDELFVAARGQGATCNGEAVSVSDTTELSKALVATEIGTGRDKGTVDAVFDRITTTVAVTRSLRCMGSCALNMCSVAIGRLDAFYEIGFGGPWDVAAASLVVEEAGGAVLDPAGGSFDFMARRVLVGTPCVARELAAKLKECKVSASEPPAP